ncbi:MAG TPA: PEGA domain-containing protein [Deltaproteobacteria bacterium]|nr:PEGA domain-containing protein [Deltaproteobacteria bacterium]
MTLLLLLLSSFTPAHAGNIADEAEVNFQLARDAYNRGDFDTALFHFMVSNRLSPNRNVTFNIGRAYEALGKYPEAYRWYQDALEAEDTPSEETVRKILESLDKIEDRIALFKVVTDPPDATVYIDRRNLGSIGQTPLDIPRRPGSYRLIIEKPGYETVETEDYDLQRTGTQIEVDLKLVPIVGRVSIEGEVGATVHVETEDAPPSCEIPCVLELPEGKQILYFRKPGFRNQPNLIEVFQDQELELVADLSPITGTLIVDAGERGALIEIDGAPVGYTPAVLTDVQVGSHELQISYGGYEPYRATFDISEDETIDMGSIDLNPLFRVTAASRFDQNVAEAPASVTLIPQEELKAFGYQSILEAIVGSRGLYPTNDLSYEGLGVRGFSRLGDYSNRILLTADGHSLNDNVFGSSYLGLDGIADLQDIQQIEVVRGPGSALYGSNAVFGVINLVTKGGGDGYQPHVALTGADQAIRARVGAGIGDESVGAWASLSGMYDPGRDYEFREYADTPSQGISEDADESLARTLHAKAWAGNLTLHGMYTTSEKEIPTGAFQTNLGDHRSANNDYRGFLEARYQSDAPNTKLDLRLFYDNYANEFIGPYGVGYLYNDQNHDQWFGALAQLNQSLGEAMSLTLGGQTRQHFITTLESFEIEALDAEPFNQPLDKDAASQIYSAYGVLDLHPGELVTFNLGGRIDRYETADTDAGDPTSNTYAHPRGALILSPGDEVLKFIAGSAFRAPSPFEFFYSDGGISQVPAAEGLSSETILTGEFEWTHAYSEVLTHTVSGYYNSINNLIDTEIIDDNGVFRYTNIDAPVRTAGAEVELRRWWRSGWMLASQISWQRTRTGGFIDGDALTNSPILLGSFMTATPLSPGVTLANKIRGESARLTQAGYLTDGAVVWDVTLTGTLDRPTLEYGIGVRNLLDWPITHPGGADLLIDELPQLGRNFFATLRVNL